MSSFGPNDPNQPAGQPPQGPPPYGPPQGQPPYGQPPYGHQGYGGAALPSYPLASWGSRLAAYLLDALVMMVVLAVPVILGVVLIARGSETTINELGVEETSMDGVGVVGILVVVLGYVLALAFAFWNQGYRQGKTGQSLGKSWLGLKVVKEQTGQPIGVGAGFGRALMHMFVDGQCYIGFLWPLWDERNRTFGDMVVGSVVIRAAR